MQQNENKSMKISIPFGIFLRIPKNSWMCRKDAHWTELDREYLVDMVFLIETNFFYVWNNIFCSA